jgi:hypothetical protein
MLHHADRNSSEAMHMYSIGHFRVVGDFSDNHGLVSDSRTGVIRGAYFGCS